MGYLPYLLVHSSLNTFIFSTYIFSLSSNFFVSTIRSCRLLESFFKRRYRYWKGNKTPSSFFKQEIVQNFLRRWSDFFTFFIKKTGCYGIFENGHTGLLDWLVCCEKNALLLLIIKFQDIWSRPASSPTKVPYPVKIYFKY